MKLSVLWWYRHNGHVSLLGRGKSPVALLAVVASDIAWGQGVLEGQEAITLCDREEGLGP